MCRKRDLYAVPDIRPLGVVVHPLGDECNTRHEAECGIEIAEFERLGDSVAILEYAPITQPCQCLGAGFTAQQLDLAHGCPPGQGSPVLLVEIRVLTAEQRIRFLDDVGAATHFGLRREQHEPGDRYRLCRKGSMALEVAGHDLDGAV